MDPADASLFSSTKSGNAGAPFISPSAFYVSAEEAFGVNEEQGLSFSKACVDQLRGILQHLYCLSLIQEKVQVLWKYVTLKIYICFLHMLKLSLSNQSQEDGFSAVNQPRVRTAQSANGGETTHCYRRLFICCHGGPC